MIPPRVTSVQPPARPLGSLRNQLLKWLLFPLLLLVAVDAVSVYRNALAAADLAYDRSLLASTRALAQRVSLNQAKLTVDVPHAALNSFESDALGRLFYKVSGLNGEFVAGYEDLPPLPANAVRSQTYPALIYFFDATYRGEELRIAALYQPLYDANNSGVALIQVAESREARRELSRKILFDTLWRQGVLVLTAALLVWMAVRFVLRPFQRLEKNLATRELTDLSAIDAGLVHRELRPLIAAINSYMGRLDTLISSQRRFIADASHQLRTPLTVLKTQAELALREADPQALRNMLISIAGTTDSTVHLANGLLSLARARYGAAEAEFGQIPLLEAAHQVALEFAPRAVHKGIDLSFDGDVSVPVHANPLLLHELIANLVDNAIRYTPTGGKVAVRVLPDATGAGLLEIEDTGPGIPEPERERVLAPFYRTAEAQLVNPSGSGLGLPIVRDIVAIHAAELSLKSGTLGGLLAAVRFPPVNSTPQ